jgi:hypothetical protein
MMFSDVVLRRIQVNNGLYSFLTSDKSGNVASATAATGPDGNWHHLVGVCDETGGNLTLYIDGAEAASGGFSALDAAGILDSHDPVDIGAVRSDILPAYDWAYNGTIDEVAIYATNLSSQQVSNHFTARYGLNFAPVIVTQPVSVTNYVSLQAHLAVAAAGTVPLSYQWMHGGSPISGATGSSYSIKNLAYSDAGDYTVGVTNTLLGNVVTGMVSAPVTITVLAPPTNPPIIPGLVMHLTFDDTLADATGRGNDATNEASGGAPLLTNDYVQGVIGKAFTYQTATAPTTNANYATLGVRPDLQFGSNSFTVSMWVQLPVNYTGGDLPFFTDAIGSTFSYPGFVFAPSFGPIIANDSSADWPGGWCFTVYDNTDTGQGVYGPVGGINDGNWHNLVYVIDTKAGPAVYVDGNNSTMFVQAGTTIAGIGNINTTNAATIGQDPTGLYPQAGSASIDDLGVWNRALTPLEASSIYMAGISNHLSYIGLPTLTMTAQSGSHLQLTWSAGNLQSAADLRGPWNTLESASSPYTYTNIPSPGNTACFSALRNKTKCTPRRIAIT